jgi:hypothetical protein
MTTYLNKEAVLKALKGRFCRPTGKPCEKYLPPENMQPSQKTPEPELFVCPDSLKCKSGTCSAMQPHIKNELCDITGCQRGGRSGKCVPIKPPVPQPTPVPTSGTGTAPKG